MNRAHVVVGNADIELAFHGEDQIHAVERVDLQVLEGLVESDVLARNMLGLRDHVERAFNQFVGHKIWLTVSKRNPKCWSRGTASATAPSVASISGVRWTPLPSCKQMISPSRARPVKKPETRAAGQRQSRPMRVHMT